MVEKNVQTRAGVAAKRSDTTRRAEVPAAAGMASSTPSTVTGPTTAGVEEEFLSGEEGDEVVSLAIDKSSAVAAGTEIQKAPGASDLASIIAIPNFTKDQVTTIVSSTNSPPVVTHIPERPTGVAANLHFKFLESLVEIAKVLADSGQRRILK
ncbi:hypothetical protein PtB15_18B220 [Puccinia triticina]|nr:hypothetical protein PtB15_18B220 [Puccinia triticina]